MAIQIASNSILPAVPSATVSSAPTTPSVAPAAPPKADTVKLSLNAQVRLLRSQGQSAQQIGSSLGLSAAAISQYLVVQLPKVVVKVEALPAPSLAVAAAPESAPTTPVPASQLPPK